MASDTSEGPDDSEWDHKDYAKFYRKGDLYRLGLWMVEMHLGDYHPGTKFWNWVLPGSEDIFAKQSFSKQYREVPLEIADSVDMALISWLQESASTPEVSESLELAKGKIHDMIDASTSDGKTSDSFHATRLLEILSELQDQVRHLSTRAEVSQLVSKIRGLHYPGKSSDGHGDRPLGRG